MLFLLYDIQSPINIGLTLRVGEQFGIPVSIYDPRGVLNVTDNREKISDFSCGALDRHPPELVDDVAAYCSRKPGRMVATCLDRTAVQLPEFRFEDADLILLGNEYDGLPNTLIAAAEAKIYIPLPPNSVPKTRSFSPIDPSRVAPVSQNGVPNLNVSIAAAIISYEYRARRPADDLASASPAQAI